MALKQGLALLHATYVGPSPSPSALCLFLDRPRVGTVFFRNKTSRAICGFLTGLSAVYLQGLRSLLTALQAADWRCHASTTRAACARSGSRDGSRIYRAIKSKRAARPHDPDATMSHANCMSLK